MLEDILNKDVPKEPVLFWLDAHSSGPHTADDGDPLHDELEVVMRLRPDALIVVDDRKDAEFEDTLDFTGWQKEYRTGEVIIHKSGMYNIPPFEEVNV